MVAHAAPSSRRRGIWSASAMGGPQLKMGGASPGPYTSSTASTKFKTFDKRSMATGVLLEPSARWMVVTCKRKKIEKLPPSMTRKYSVPSSATCPLAPTRSRMMKPAAPSPSTSEERRPQADHDHRLPSDVPRGFAIAASFVLRDQGGRGGGDAVADDGPHRRDLVANADRAEARSGDVGVESRNEIGVDEVEGRLQRHAERQRRAEASQRAGERSVDDAIARRAGAHGDSMSSLPFFRGESGAASAGVRSKQVSGTLRFRRTSAVACTKRSVTGSW